MKYKEFRETLSQIDNSRQRMLAEYRLDIDIGNNRRVLSLFKGDKFFIEMLDFKSSYGLKVCLDEMKSVIIGFMLFMRENI